MATNVLRSPSTGRSFPLGERFAGVRNTSLRITEALTPEDQMLQSMPDASPTKWHLAHTTWFFETFILAPNLRGYRPFDERYKYLFNSYYKQLGGHPFRGARGLMSRPTLQEVHNYRRHVDAVMREHIEKFGDDVLALIELGLNHEQQHQELIITDIKHGLWSGPVRPEPLGKRDDGTPSRSLGWSEIEGGIYQIGHHGEGFAFDNEGPRHEVLLRPFRIASRAVTNGEYLDFMNDEGYSRPELWLSDGWDAVYAQKWTAPLYWLKEYGVWRQFVRSAIEVGMKEIDRAEPVCHISYYEADAFARWSGKRLPTEAEWEVTAVCMPVKGTFLEDDVLSPKPAQGEGLQQLLGDVWEWTSSPYVSYPGFKPQPGAIGEYNGKFMCNQFILRGGSCATPASHIRASYRNFFPPHARWQFSGIRLADDCA
jgi:ergothioneine biosynthesis protein EgtB